MRIVIVGGGPAAVEAALSIREIDKISPVTLVSEEYIMPYRRPLLVKMLTEDVPDERFFICSGDFYRRNNISIRLNTAAVKIEPELNLLQLSSGETMEYDRLLLATGGNAIKLAFSGNQQQKVYSFHKYNDVMLLKNQLRPGIKTAIIGGGVLGLEIADRIIHIGGEVVLLERSNRLLGSVLDQHGSNFLQQQLEHIDKLTVLLNSRLLALNPAGNRIHCQSDSGKLPDFTADLVISAIGITPADNLLPAPWQCDEYLRLLPFQNIYAAGDVLKLPGVSGGIYRTARQMGAVAGMNAAGKKQRFVPIPPEMRSSFFNINIFSAGQSDCSNSQIKVQSDTNNWSKLCYQDNKLVGCTLIGDVRDGSNYYNAIVSKS